MYSVQGLEDYYGLEASFDGIGSVALSSTLGVEVLRQASSLVLCGHGICLRHWGLDYSTVMHQEAEMK